LSVYRKGHKVKFLGGIMHFKKNLIVVVLVLIVIFTMIGCSSEQENDKFNGGESSKEAENIRDEKILRISTSISPYSLPLFYMAESDLLGEDIKIDVSLHKDRQEAIAKFNKNEVDLINLSVQEMAHMYNKNMPLKFLEVSNWASFKLMTLDESINDLNDLKGQKVYLSSKGGPVDILTQTVLQERGIDIQEEITFQYLKQGELTKMAIGEMKNIKIFVLREPFASQAIIENDNIRIVHDLGKEWENIHKHKFPQSGTGVTLDFYENDLELVDLFSKKNEEAIEWVLNNPEKAAEIGEKYLKNFDQEVLKESIKNIDMHRLDSQSSKEALEIYFSYVLEFRPEMIGNKMPDHEYYE
jgi:NitT/TauT family transport system substrate-binding protein